MREAMAMGATLFRRRISTTTASHIQATKMALPSLRATLSQNLRRKSITETQQALLGIGSSYVSRSAATPDLRAKRPYTARSAKQKHLHLKSNVTRALATQASLGTATSDVVIVGGGVVGLALACSLAESPIFQSSGASITLIEASSFAKSRNWSASKQNTGKIDDWENRAIYLTEENHAWLLSLGIGEYLVSERMGGINGMHVFDGRTGASLDFNAPGSPRGRLGSMVEISNLQQALLHRLDQLASQASFEIKILDSSKVETIVPSSLDNASGDQIALTSATIDARPELHLEGGSAPIKARVLVGADGHNSPVRKYAGIGAQGWGYERMGVVATMQIQAPVEDERIAYQRFLPSGTIAWLPLSNDAASLVWTLPPDTAKAIIGLQKLFENGEHQGTSPIAHLITAGFRLPWSNLEPILNRLAHDHITERIDLEWLVPAIEEQLVSAAEELPPEGNVPQPASKILDRSVAGFPLKLSHAQTYLGSSLREPTFAEAGAAAFLPSQLAQRAIKNVSSITSRLAGMPSQSDETTGPAHGRTVLIGDAAHSIHPLAGQGLNLGIADARSLSNALIKATELGEDLGGQGALEAYPRERYLANQLMLSAVDQLHWLFVSPKPGDPANGSIGDLASRALVWGRSTGFEVLNELDIVKRAIIGYAGSAK